MKKTFCFTLYLFTHNCILVSMAMKKSLFLSFPFLDGTKVQ
ncbi:hypothetical protein HMPREF9073_02817 [Capnocytophaga sp. oral taxon 326 str. F0382]|nr:hypothetical protein HMPREF9073_02817 [Capnocytophaga sp. oral taxon 326 str. F0382]